MKNNQITNNFLKKVSGPDNLKETKKIIKKLKSKNGIETDAEIVENENKKEIKISNDERLLLKLHDVSIANYKKDKNPKTKKEICHWEFDEDEFNKKMEEFEEQNELITNPIINDFLKEILNLESDLEYIKFIILALIDGIETDEEIHEKTDIKLNTVRKLLYKLHDASIATYKRNKDPETQWFTYTWKFDKEESNEKITAFYTERLKEREELLDELENNLYFVCCMEPAHFKGNYTESSEYEFYCPICDYELEPYDAKKEKSLLKRRITTDKKNFKKFEEIISE
jgi:transcription initiation factor TFIIE subunit alpha